MDSSSLIIFWFVLGAILFAMELLFPMFIAIFTAISSWVLCGCYFFGYQLSIYESLQIWVISSLLLTALFNPLCRKYFPSRTSYTPINELDEAIGSQVQVVKKVMPFDTTGRVSFRGSTWSAQSLEEEIPEGSWVTIIAQKDQSWIVSKYSIE